MTNQEVNTVFREAIANNIQDASSLPEDIAEQYALWVQSLINMANQPQQEQPEENNKTQEEQPQEEAQEAK